MHACLLCWGALLLKKCWRKYFLHQIFISCLFSFISFHLFQGHSITAITCSVYPSSMTLRKHIYLLSLISFFVEFTLERNIFFLIFFNTYIYIISYDWQRFISRLIFFLWPIRTLMWTEKVGWLEVWQKKGRATAHLKIFFSVTQQ